MYIDTSYRTAEPGWRVVSVDDGSFYAELGGELPPPDDEAAWAAVVYLQPVVGFVSDGGGGRLPVLGGGAAARISPADPGCLRLIGPTDPDPSVAEAAAIAMRWAMRPGWDPKADADAFTGEDTLRYRWSARPHLDGLPKALRGRAERLLDALDGAQLLQLRNEAWARAEEARPEA